MRNKARLVGEELRLQVEETRKFLEDERRLRRAAEAAAAEAEARLNRRLEQASADISALRQQVCISTCLCSYEREFHSCQSVPSVAAFASRPPALLDMIAPVQRLACSHTLVYANVHIVRRCADITGS